MSQDDNLYEAHQDHGDASRGYKSHGDADRGYKNVRDAYHHISSKPVPHDAAKPAKTNRPVSPTQQQVDQLKSQLDNTQRRLEEAIRQITAIRNALAAASVSIACNDDGTAGGKLNIPL